MASPVNWRCYLLELPPELRLAIYNLAFPTRIVHLWIDNDVYRWRSFGQQASMSLLATCSFIHHEASAVFHDNTTVHFSVCDEFERPLSRYIRFAALHELNAASFHQVRKVQISLHTLTEPIFPALHAHIRGLLARLGQCAKVRALEIQFEFWSTISDSQLYQIYATLCEIDFDRAVEIKTRKADGWAVLYQANSLLGCLRMVQADISFKSQGLPLLMQNQDIGAKVGPRELVISSAG